MQHSILLKLQTKNYTIISQFNELVNYINTDIKTYISEVFLEYSNNEMEEIDYIMEYVDGTYVITNKISDYNLRYMRANMDDSDAEDFNRFIEKHWGKEALKATMLYDAEEGELEHTPFVKKEEKTPKPKKEEKVVNETEPKKRGRKPKTNK